MRFCTNCGQSLVPGAAFCVACGAQTNVPPTGTQGQISAGIQPGSPPYYAQAAGQAQDDPLLAGLAAGSVAGQMASAPVRRARRPRSRLRGCGCLLLVLAVLAGPFIGVALTSGRLHLIFTYVAGGMVLFFLLVLLIGVFATRGGREALSEGCLDALLGGFLGGG